MGKVIMRLNEGPLHNEEIKVDGKLVAEDHFEHEGFNYRVINNGDSKYAQCAGPVKTAEEIAAGIIPGSEPAVVVPPVEEVKKTKAKPAKKAAKKKAKKVAKKKAAKKPAKKSAAKKVAKKAARKSPAKKKVDAPEVEAPKESTAGDQPIV